MKFRSILAASAVIVATGFGTATIAQDLPMPVQARQGQFKMMGLNIGVLVAMARGEADYDADRAQAAADNLVTLSSIDQSFHWPEGSDNMTLVGTRALPEIWDNLPDVLDKWGAFGAAADGLAATAGEGLDPMRAALGPVGNSCSACHDDYRASD
ncbi:MAG: Cytochrome c556 [Rhodobacteraceae bacterium HLUCCO18]|nr:MAG: Cytochrome c556 [Rhodobacteraceae bacterium HLUCCO18]